MVTEHVAQGGVHQVGCRVVQTNARAASFIHVSLYALAHFQRTGNQFALVTNRLTVFLVSLTLKLKPLPFSSPLSPT